MKRTFLKFVAPPLAVLFVFALGIHYYVYPRFEQLALEQERENLVELTVLPCRLLDSFNEEVKLGRMTLERAQEMAIHQLRALRHGDPTTDYYFVLDTTGKLILNPSTPEREGQNVLEVTDVKGFLLYRAFLDCALREGGGFVEYTWAPLLNPDKSRGKRSHVVLYPQWGWIIGTGVYADATAKRVGALRARLQQLIAGSFILILLVAGYAATRGAAAESARTRTEALLRDREARFRLLAESASDWIFLSADDGRMLYSSPACRDITGYAPEEFEADPELLPRIVHEDDAGLWALHRCAYCKADATLSLDLRVRTRAGEVRWISHTCRAARDSDGRHMGRWASNRDITERKHGEAFLARQARELARTNAELTRRNRELDQFTYMASHDLQEPLRKLMAFSGMLPGDLQDRQLPERAASDLRFIAESARQMQALVQGLLQLSRAGKSEMVRQWISLDDCIDQALNTLSTSLQERSPQIFRSRNPHVYADKTLLTQVYQNLIGNALKFCSAEQPLIRFTVEKIDGTMVFGVADNGIGIAPEYMAQVFEPFKRLHSRAEYEGSGIGLAICGKVIERHGGRLWVESEPGRGAHFRFSLSEEETSYDGE